MAEENVEIVRRLHEVDFDDPQAILEWLIPRSNGGTEGMSRPQPFIEDTKA